MEKIRIHYATNNEPKLVYFNSDTRKMYENLSYSDSLISTGSCTFTLIPDEIQATGDIDTDIGGFEYVYIENAHGEIVWGGILVSFSGGKDRLTVNCLGMKYALDLIRLTADLSITGNALTSIENLLDVAKTKRELPFVMDSNSLVVDDTALNFTTGKTIYQAIKDIVDSAYLRFIFTYEKSGITITPKILVRSVLGISPEGVGINRGLQSTETDDKVQLKYSIDSPRETNLIDFNINYDLRGMVSKGKLITSDAVYDSSSSPVSEFLGSYFGNVERTEVAFEITDPATAQAVANGLVNDVSFRIDVTFEDSYNFEINIGDRISLLIKTKLLRLFTPGAIDNPITPRVEEKNVSVKDGYRIITLKLNANNSQKSLADIIEQVNKLKTSDQNISTRLISS